MIKLKKALLSKSLFRQCYIICLFACNVSYVHYIAYGVLALMVIWGSFLVVYNEITRRTSLKTRYGFWLLALIACSVITMFIHIMHNFMFNLVMILHLLICFFIYYSIHTEKNLNFQHELFNTARIIIFSSTVLGFFGLLCLVRGIQFEFMSVKFIVYENRFTGLFVNPNQLGFITVVALLFCHLMIKQDFVQSSGCRRISRLWIAACLAINSISLLLSDSNGATILIISYSFFYFIYKLFGTESSFSAKQIIVRTLSCLLAGMVIVSSVFLLRTVCQLGIAQMIKNNQSIITPFNINPDDSKSQVVTFEHENANLDSGRFTLWYQGGEMFIKRPVFGIGKGNIDYYGKEMFEDGVKFSNRYGDLAPFLVDFHNGYLTILVCAGITGFAFFRIFILKFVAKTTRHVLRDESLHQSAFPCLFSFISAYMVYSLIEVTLLFNLMFTVVFFWMILGYTSCFLTKNVPDHPIGYITIFGKKFRKTLF